MKRITRGLVFTAILIFTNLAAIAQESATDGFHAGIYKAKNGKTMPSTLHNVWNLAYSEPGLVPWIFQQRRN